MVRAWPELYIRILLDGADPSTFLYTALSSLDSFLPRHVFGVRAAPPQASVVLVVVKPVRLALSCPSSVCGRFHAGARLDECIFSCYCLSAHKLNL